ncbi:hypothetical protein HFD88_009938 [Aspergillus terreus]|nr:hypothetical protein HFD88_009938 [Aspergillus terreus]
MLQHLPRIARLGAPPPLSFSSAPTISLTRAFASRRAAAIHSTHEYSDDDFEAARQWLVGFDAHPLPRHIGHISFSRSGGPGGQNVNKVNSKATLKVPLASLLPLVPRVLHPSLRTSRYFAERTETLVIHAEESRKQAANVESCYDKLHQLLKTTAKDVIPGETSQAQRDRVHKLKKAENEARIKFKKLHSSKKSSRRGSKYDE